MFLLFALSIEYGWMKYGWELTYAAFKETIFRKKTKFGWFPRPFMEFSHTLKFALSLDENVKWATFLKGQFI